MIHVRKLSTRMTSEERVYCPDTRIQVLGKMKKEKKIDTSYEMKLYRVSTSLMSDGKQAVIPVVFPIQSI